MKEEDDIGAKLIQEASSQIDSLIGKYKNEDEMKMGDRRIDDLVEIK